MSVLLFVGRGGSQQTIDFFAERLEATLSAHGVWVRVERQSGPVAQLGDELGQLVERSAPSVVLVVGYTASVTALEVSSFSVPLAVALPDLPGNHEGPYGSVVKKLGRLVSGAMALVVADENVRSLLEYRVSGAAGKVFLPHQVAYLGELAQPLPLFEGASRVLVSGHDFRFVEALLAFLRRQRGVEVQVQEWDLNTEVPSEEQRRQAEWAQLVVCEWAGRQAVWFSRNLRPGQRLLVHLHGFEAQAAWIDDLNLAAVEKIVVVSEFYRQQLVVGKGWPAQKVVVVPNSVAVESFNRPKHADAPFHVGLLGFTPLLKRPDRALDILSALLDMDERFVLHLRGEQPWRHRWVWNYRPVEADIYRQLYARIGADERLRRRVVFEPYGSNVESWLGRIGWLLSVSARETFHVAVAEGMAAGAVPVIFERDGAAEIFSDRWVFSSVEEIAAFIEKTVREQRWQAQSVAAREFAQRFDHSAVLDAWLEVLR